MYYRSFLSLPFFFDLSDCLLQMECNKSSKIYMYIYIYPKFQTMGLWFFSCFCCLKATCYVIILSGKYSLYVIRIICYIVGYSILWAIFFSYFPINNYQSYTCIIQWVLDSCSHTSYLFFGKYQLSYVTF